MIQNADDAGADKISFILDKRQLGTNKIFCKDFNKLQGPALLSWNNSVFTPTDLKGITTLGTGSKREMTMKIGRFGVGFNSVYHITDAPQFITNASDYAIFDPLRAHLEEHLANSESGLRISNIEKYFKKNDNEIGCEIYRDVAAGFEVPGFDLNSSTMFRLALRSTPSNISGVTFDCNSIRKTIEQFLSQDDDFLIFLKKVRLF